MKSTKSFIALAVMSMAAAVSTSSYAQNSTSRASVEADLQAYNQSGLANLNRGDITPDFNSPAYIAAEQRYAQLRGQKTVQSTLTRAEVDADLQAYNQSGLANLNRGDITPDFNSPAYIAAEQRYNQLRGQKTVQSALTRAEVKSDLKAYQAAGLSSLTAGNRDVQDYSPAYLQAVQKYNQLRSHS